METLKFKHLAASFLIVISLVSTAQSNFQLDYGVPSVLGPLARVYSIEIAPDGGYIMAGYAMVDSDYDMYLCKTNAAGELAWTRTFGGSDTDMGYAVKNTSEGGYIIAGTTRSFPSPTPRIYIVKTDQDGDTLWTKTYGSGSSNFGYDIQPTSDGNYVVTGNINSSICLFKINGEGELLWQNLYEGDEALSVQETTDNGFIITGQRDGDAWSEIVLMKTDSDGEPVWYKTYNAGDEITAHAVRQTSDGGYAVTGATGVLFTDAALMKTDSDGNFEWSKKFASANTDEGLALTETSDGAFILTGSVGNGFTTTDLLVIKAGSDGDTIWTKSFGETILDKGYSIQQTSDGGYVIGGGHNQAGYLIKTDQNGYSGDCNESHIPITVSDLPLTVVSESITPLFLDLTVTSGTTIVGTEGVSNILCSSVQVEQIHDNKFFMIYPTPIHHEATISSSSGIQQVQIFDVFGKQMLKQQAKAYSVTLNTEAFSSGTYIVHALLQNGAVEARRVVVNK